MEFRRIIFLLAVAVSVFSGCTNTNKGTEVTNPQDEIIFTSEKYHLSLTLPAGWSFTEYSETVRPEAGVYSDPLGSAEILAKFVKGRSNFVVLYDTIAAGESLTNYASPRHQPADTITPLSYDDGEMVTVNQAASGTDGAWVGFVYISAGGIVVTLRAELNGDTAAELESTWNEFVDIARTLTI